MTERDKERESTTEKEIISKRGRIMGRGNKGGKKGQWTINVRGRHRRGDTTGRRERKRGEYILKWAN